MNPNESSPDDPNTSEIGDKNVERLLGQAYQPETPDAEFARRVEAMMSSVARERAEARANATPRVTLARRPASQWKKLAWSAVAATVLVGVGFVVGRNLGRHGDGGGLANEPAIKTTSPEVLAYDANHLAKSDAFVATNQTAPAGESTTSLVGDRGLTPRVRPALAAADKLEIGTTLETEAGQRRRATLIDGSTLYLNQNTHVTLAAERKITLDAGEIYVEVAPREAIADGKPSPFVVHTARRDITALGTKFAVRTNDRDTGVLVTQGKVQVSDFHQPIAAGQLLATLGDGDVLNAPLEKTASPISPLPRASHVLDWTRDLVAAAESPLVPASPHAGGSIVARDPNGQEARLSLRNYHVDVHVEDGFARTTIDQTYFNHTSWRLEGTFHFPLPPDASLSRLAMYVDGKLMEGGMAERNYAREVFEKIVRTQKDPALLEWVDGSTFKMRVFPLEARQEKRIILSYTQRLDSLYGHWKYRFPTGHSLEAVRDWSFHARVKNGAEFTWNCESHDMKRSTDGTDLVLDAEAKEVKLDRDVVLRLTDRAFEFGQPLTPNPSPRRRGEGGTTGDAGINPGDARTTPLSPSAGRGVGGEGSSITRFSSTIHDGQRYLMLRFRPELPTKAQRQRRDWVFLFESSGDRDPVLARVQADVIKTLLQNAEHDDTFAILTAGTQVRTFANELMTATPENVKKAVEFLDGVHLVGALDLGQALAAAEPFVKSGKNAYLVHVGSGMPVLGERAEEKLLKRIPAGARYVGVGVGKHWSRQFMKTAASRTGGYFTQINPDEPVAWRAFDLYSTLNTPRLLNAGVVDHAERAAFLIYNDSISHGEELCAIARIAAPGAAGLPEKITVSGTLDSEQFRRVIAVESVTPKADYLPRTWAKLRIDQLLADDAAKHKDEIISLSKAMYVMSPFTSLLVLENDQMYVQFNVDRGRKDHWAMYACPDQIQVVHEPLPDPKITIAKDTTAGTDVNRPSVSDVLDTVLIRLAPTVLSRPNGPKLELDAPLLTGSQLYLPASAGSSPQQVDFGRLVRLLQQTIEPNTWNPVERESLAGEFSSKRSLVVNQTQAFFDAPISELATFLSEVSANQYEVRDLAETKRQRHLLWLLQSDKSNIPFPDERGLEYPDAAWWEEMKERRKHWSRVDLTLPSRAEEKIADKLRDPVTLEFVETPLGDVVDFLRDYTGVNIVVDKRALADAGVTTDTPVTIHVEQITMKSVLNILLGRLNLSYRVRDDVLQITSQPRAADELAWRVYTAHDFVVPLTEDLFRLRILDRRGVEDQKINYDRLLEDATRAKLDLARANAQLKGAVDEATDRRGDAFRLRELWKSTEDVDRDAILHSLVRWRAISFEEWRRGVIPGQINERLEREQIETYRLRIRASQLLGSTSDRGTWPVLQADPPECWLAGVDNRGFDVTRPTWQALRYEYPRFSGDARVFSDLLAYAPGMHTTDADVLAVLDAEAKLSDATAIGRVEPAARELIDKARSAGWQRRTIAARDGGDPTTITFDGAGRFRIERTTSEGLREQVLCDGVTLLNLYSELGVGARRAASRFHRQPLVALVPWAVAPADDLARGADVVLAGERTVAIIPRGADDAKDSNGQNTTYARTHLIFADDGRLAERRLVEMPGGKTLFREVYAADGAVRLLDSDDKLLAEFPAAIEPCAPPDLTPDVKQLVILPLPFRGGSRVAAIWARVPNGRYDSLSEDDALALVSERLTTDPATVRQIVGQRFFRTGDRRIGFYTLLLASGLRWDPQSEQQLTDGSQLRFDPVADHPDSALARYIFLHQRQMSTSGKIEEMDLASGTRASFIAQLAEFRDLHARSTNDKVWKGSEAEREIERQRGLAFVRNSKSNLFGWAVLGMLLDHSGDSAFYRSVADVCPRFESVPGLAYAARYETARARMKSGDWQQAHRLFGELHAETLKRGLIPPVDANFRAAIFGDGTGAAVWTKLWQDAADSAIKRDDRGAVLAFAWQCRELGDRPLADTLVSRFLAGVSGEDRLAATLAAVEYLDETKQFARADLLFRPSLENAQLNRSPTLWRLASVLADKNHMTARAVACLDRAIDIEFSHLLDDIPLEPVRATFQSLLSRYEQLARTIASPDSEPPPDIVRRVIRAADRWRSLDPDDTAACQTAARVLSRLGARELAWEYVTTPFSDKPAEPPAWLGLGQTLRDQGSMDLADRAYALAFEAEPANAQVLWEHAQMLEQSGKADAARRFYQQITDGQWDAQFHAIQTQARKAIGTEQP